MKMNYRIFASALLALSLATACTRDADPAGSGQQSTSTDRNAADQLLDRSKATLDRIRTQPNFAKLVNNARAVLIVPRLYKVGLIAGGKGGRGVLLAQDKASGEWSAPVFYRVFSASVGVQIGVEVAEIAVLIMSDRALDSLLASDFKLGADTTLTSGTSPLKARPSSDSYAFTMSQGAFVGIALEGIKIVDDENRNRTYYGQSLTPREIVDDENLNAPTATALRESLRGRKFAEATARRAETANLRKETDDAVERAKQLANRLAEYEYRESDRGVVLVLQDVLFDTGKADVKPGARARLRPLAEFLKQFKQRKVAIEGHTDIVGSPAFNKTLSQRRAEVVRSLLVELGNNPARMSVHGYGADLPVATNATGEGRQLNRRVEIVIETVR